jgi:hypothetical protein
VSHLGGCDLIRKEDAPTNSLALRNHIVRYEFAMEGKSVIGAGVGHDDESKAR